MEPLPHLLSTSIFFHPYAQSRLRSNLIQFNDLFFRNILSEYTYWLGKMWGSGWVIQGGGRWCGWERVLPHECLPCLTNSSSCLDLWPSHVQKSQQNFWWVSFSLLLFHELIRAVDSDSLHKAKPIQNLDFPVYFIDYLATFSSMIY